MIIRTSHLNQQRFKELAELEVRDIQDESEKENEIRRLMDQYFQDALINPIMQADYHAYRVGRLNPGEIDVLPFIFFTSDLGDHLCQINDLNVSMRSWRALFGEYLIGNGGKVYFSRNDSIYFGFPKVSIEESLLSVAVLGNHMNKWNEKCSSIYLFTKAAYWFEDIVNNPGNEWPDNDVSIFTTHTRYMDLEEYLEKFPRLLDIYLL